MTSSTSAPKNGVKAWPDDRIKVERQIDYDFPTGQGWGRGYYLLVFHLCNYITACKTCNTPLKSNYFPIAGDRRGPQSDDPARLAPEKPYLLYPLGETRLRPRGGPRLRRYRAQTLETIGPPSPPSCGHDRLLRARHSRGIAPRPGREDP